MKRNMILASSCAQGVLKWPESRLTVANAIGTQRVRPARHSSNATIASRMAFLGCRFRSVTIASVTFVVAFRKPAAGRVRRDHLNDRAIDPMWEKTFPRHGQAMPDWVSQFTNLTHSRAVWRPKNCAISRPPKRVWMKYSRRAKMS